MINTFTSAEQISRNFYTLSSNNITKDSILNITIPSLKRQQLQDVIELVVGIEPKRNYLSDNYPLMFSHSAEDFLGSPYRSVDDRRRAYNTMKEILIPIYESAARSREFAEMEKKGSDSNLSTLCDAAIIRTGVVMRQDFNPTRLIKWNITYLSPSFRCLLMDKLLASQSFIQLSQVMVSLNVDIITFITLQAVHQYGENGRIEKYIALPAQNNFTLYEERSSQFGVLFYPRPTSESVLSSTYTAMIRRLRKEIENIGLLRSMLRTELNRGRLTDDARRAVLHRYEPTASGSYNQSDPTSNIEKLILASIDRLYDIESGKNNLVSKEMKGIYSIMSEDFKGLVKYMKYREVTVKDERAVVM